MPDERQGKATGSVPMPRRIAEMLDTATRFEAPAPAEMTPETRPPGGLAFPSGPGAPRVVHDRDVAEAFGALMAAARRGRP